jgi:hypothetical protein
MRLWFRIYHFSVMVGSVLQCWFRTYGRVQTAEDLSLRGGKTSGALLVVSATIWKERPVEHLCTSILKWAQWKQKAHDEQRSA